MPYNSLKPDRKPAVIPKQGSRPAAAPQPSCTIVICTRNRPLELDRCLAAVTSVAYPNYDVLVVDNAPSDRQARDLSLRWNVAYIEEPEPGLSKARNRGARACDSDVVAFIDDDAVPETDWLEALAVEFRDPLVMAVAGRRIPAELKTASQQLCDWVRERNERRVVDRGTPYWFEIANFGGIGTGMNMAFRREAFDLWPGFHERLGRGTPLRGGEEHHAFFSLIDRGYRVVHTPEAVVRHPFPATMSALRSKQWKDLAAAMGYITLLLAEEPTHRKTILKYVFEAMRGTRRMWRTQSSLSPNVVPWWSVPFARLTGPLTYVWSRLTDTGTVRAPQSARVGIRTAMREEPVPCESKTSSR